VSEVLARLRDRTAKIGVMGLGYVGLPLCRAFARAGYTVLGFDIDPKKVEELMAGRSYVDAVPAEELAEIRVDDRFSATTEMRRVSELDAVAICVPTPLSAHRDPDTSYIERTATTIAPHLADGALVVLESTTYPGTTAEVLEPLLAAGSGGERGEGFLLAYSPEREDPGNAQWTTDRIPKVVGADDPRSREAALALYEPTVSRVVPVSSTRAAEATKLLENVYRCVNIAVVNELKRCFHHMGIDIFEVIDAASTKPFGFQPFWPGPGVGGQEYGFRTRFIELASEVNAAMPEWVVERCMDALNEHRMALKGADVLLLGVSYKKDLGDVRESPALEVIDGLRRKGAEVSFHDPVVPRLGRGRLFRYDMKSTPLTPERLQEADLVVILTDHSKVDYAMVVEHARVIVDARNATRKVRGDSASVFLA
jgi:UDP-N-acetyl-D-glucosamine dehydrogenase